MQVIDDNRCFVCGKENPVGLKAEFIVDPELRKAETTVKIPEVFQGWQGITHGGIISALLDEICAQACMASGLQIVTSELKIRFRSPLPTGSTVKVFGEVVGERRRIIDVKGRMELDGKVVAEADVTMFRT
ncbi:MAG: PaaI family thioesterase [Desulfuromonadales bacterium]|nr:PaaI family thioesterase [Desulfuromonadales bacterium]